VILDSQEAIMLQELKIATSTALKGDYKVPGGKLIRVTIKKNDNMIQKIAITGDFFFYPEEAFPQFEQALTGIKIDEEAIREAVSLAYKKLEIVSVGVELEDFVNAIMHAVRGRPDA